jgi:hypothetical protein
MLSIAERAAELVKSGIDIAAAYNAAAIAFQKDCNASHEAHLQEEIRKEQEKRDTLDNVREFLGFRVAGFRSTSHMPTAYSCKARETGVAVKPAELGVSKAKGNPVTLFAPQLWVFVDGETPIYLAQSDVARLVSVVGKIGLRKVVAAMLAVGSAEAIQAHQAAKELAESKDVIVNRKK